jgi:hypothetical protein
VKPRSRANNVKERRLEAEQQEEAKNKFVANVPKLQLEVSLSQFSFCACCLHGRKTSVFNTGYLGKPNKQTADSRTGLNFFCNFLCVERKDSMNVEKIEHM